jgi:replicative DNA helicase/5S rRNA maturation endonuclease (ribonuclease M5)
LDNFELIKERLNIMDVIQETVPLKRNGKVWKGLCPFHAEQTPSFTVYPQDKRFHCFGCRAGGTVIDFLMIRENIKDPHSILELISSAYNIVLSGMNAEAGKKRKAIIQSNRKTVAELYRAVSGAEQYIINRGISKETSKTFGLGYDANKNALIIPFLNTYGEVVGISERNLNDTGPKYINSAENEVFKKSQLLYGLDKARKHINEKIYIVEGYFDVMALHEMGEPVAVAYCGQSLTDGQAHLLSKYMTKETKIYLVPDNDKTGLEMIKKNVNELRSVVKNPIGIVKLPDSVKDVNDLLLAGQNIKTIKSEHHEIFLLKQELDRCLELQDEYEVSRQFADSTQNKMIRAEMAEYLAKRWKKSITLVNEHMNSDAESVDVSSDMYTFSEMMNDYRLFVAKGDEGKIYTNLKAVDGLIKGMRPGEVCTLLGRSGAGKTTFILNLIYNVAVKQKHNVVFSSLELSRVNILPQFIQIHKQMTEGKVAQLVSAGEADEELIKLNQIMDERLRVVDRGGQSLKDVERYIKIANEQIFDKPVSMVVIDYFQYLKTDGKKSAYEEMSQMARDLKEMAKRLNCLVVALTQANREGGGDGSEKLTMKSARDTGAIEESSDYMIGIYRPAANPKLTEDERQSMQHEMFCQVLKNRWGRTGEVELYFDGMVKTIKDVDR